MLLLLHIENIAVIERADITFQPGFNALTGETGAGKSIVIDAMGAVLGQRVSRDLVRTGEQRASVSAMFSDVDSSLEVLQGQGIAPDEEGMLLLQRDIQADGKSVCRINGRPCTAAQLRQVGTALLNIHGQHDGQQLLDETQHIRYLDSFGKVDAPLHAYQEAYSVMRALGRDIERMQMDDAERSRRIDTLEREIEELEENLILPSFRKLSKFVDCNKPFFKKLMYKACTKAKSGCDKWHDYEMRVAPFNKDKPIYYEFTACPAAEFAIKHGLTDIMPALCNVDFASMELIHAKLIRTTTCSNGCKCDYTICGDKDPYCKEHPEYRDEAGYRRNK